MPSSLAAASVPACRAATFGQILTFLHGGQTSPVFDVERMKTLRAQMIENPMRIRSSQDGSPEAVLAAFEASARTLRGQQASYRFEELLLSKRFRDRPAQRRIQRELRIFQNRHRDGAYSRHRLVQQLEDIYAIQNGLGHGGGFVGAWTPRDSMIRQRVEGAILTSELTEALRDLGLVRDPRGLERIQAFRLAHREIENGILTTALNLLGANMGLLRHGGVAFPNEFFLQRKIKNIPPALIVTIRSQGFESAMPALREYFGMSVWVDIALMRLRSLYLAGMLAYAGYIVSQNYRWMLFAADAATTDRAEVVEYDRAHFDAEQRRQEQFDSWFESFCIPDRSFCLDPNRPEHRARMDEQWRVLRARPDSDFMLPEN